MSQTFESSQLTTGLLPGDENAFSFFYKKYYNEIVFFAWKIVHHTHQAEDITSESFIKLWHMPGVFDSEQHVRSFLYISARNACYNYLKHMNRLVDRHQKFFLFLDADQPTAECNFPELNVSEISAEIRKLPLQQRRVCTLLFLQGQDIDFVARKLKLSPQTVRNHKTRALHNLRTTLSNT